MVGRAKGWGGWGNDALSRSKKLTSIYNCKHTKLNMEDRHLFYLIHLSYNSIQNFPLEWSKDNGLMNNKSK